MEIKGIALKDGKMEVMDPTGRIVKCPTRPTVEYDASGSEKPTYDEDTNTFVCGSDQADVVLQELLTNLPKNRKQKKLPEIIIKESAGQNTATK